MQRYELTAKDGSMGGKVSAAVRKADVAMRKKELKLRDFEAKVELIKAFASSPAWAGTTAFMAVTAIQKAVEVVRDITASDQQKKAAQTWLQQIQSQVQNSLNQFAGQVLGPLSFILTGTLSSPFGALSTADFEALKFALTIYVATGGNLVGILQTAGSGLSAAALAAAK